MIHQAALMALLALTHIVCLAAMTERRYSIGKTVLAYTLFTVFFIGWTLAVSIWFGAKSPYTAPTMFSATIGAAFFIFMQNKSDGFFKNLFFFLSYCNLLCIF